MSGTKVPLLYLRRLVYSGLGFCRAAVFAAAAAFILFVKLKAKLARTRRRGGGRETAAELMPDPWLEIRKRRDGGGGEEVTISHSLCRPLSRSIYSSSVSSCVLDPTSERIGRDKGPATFWRDLSLVL